MGAKTLWNSARTCHRPFLPLPCWSLDCWNLPHYLLGARQVVSNFTSVRLRVVWEWIGVRLLREQQSKIKLLGVLRSTWLHPSTKINLNTTTPKSTTNARTNKHTNTQPTKQTNKQINKKQTNKQTQENTRTEPLSSLPYHGDDAMVQFRIDMSLNFCCILLLICFTADPFHCRCISTGPI